MTNYTNPVPPFRVIPVTKGCDSAFSVRRTDGNGAPVDWDSAIKLSVDVDKTAPTVIDCPVTGPLVSVVIPKAVADLVKGSTTWQLVRDDDLDTPLMVGNFERHDGAAT